MSNRHPVRNQTPYFHQTHMLIKYSCEPYQWHKDNVDSWLGFITKLNETIKWWYGTLLDDVYILYLNALRNASFNNQDISDIVNSRWSFVIIPNTYVCNILAYVFMSAVCQANYDMITLLKNCSETITTTSPP